MSGIVRNWRKTKRFAFFLNFGVLIISIIVSIFIAEHCLSFFAPQKATLTILNKGTESKFDSVLGWTQQINSTIRVENSDYNLIYKVNGEGAVDEYWNISKPVGYKRIVFLGDSFTQGTQVEEEYRFVNIIEDKLGPGYQTLNFGQEGYSTCQEFLMINRTLKYNPDIVVLVVYMGNDLTDNLDNNSGSRPLCYFNNERQLTYFTAPKEIVSIANSPLRNVFEKTNLGVFLTNTIRYSRLSYIISKAMGYNPEYPSATLFRTNSVEEYSPNLNKTVDTIIGANNYLKEKNISFIVVIIPHIIQVEEKIWKEIIEKYDYIEGDYDLMLPNKLLIRSLMDAEIDYVDTTPLLRKDYLETRPFYYRNDRHLNKDGHSVVAEAIYKEIKDELQ